MLDLTPLTTRAHGSVPARGFTLLVWALVALACKGEGDGEATSVDAIVEASLRHESRLLELLEANRARPDEARRATAAYVDAHAAELDLLASRRGLLEREPAAFARALEAHGSRMADNLARRRRLLESAPALMADPAIRAALGRLAAL